MELFSTLLSVSVVLKMWKMKAEYPVDTKSMKSDKKIYVI